MLTIDTSTRLLEILLGGVPVAELPWFVTYAVQTADDVTLVSNAGLTTNTTPVEVIPVGDDQFQNQLKYFSIKNPNTASATVIVQLDDNGTDREIIRVTLATQEILSYRDNSWQVLDSLGALKVTYKITDQGIYAQSAPAATSLTDLLTISAGYYVDAHVVAINRSGVSTTIRMSLAPNGVADATSQYFAYDLPLSGNNIYDSAEIIADESDVIRVYTNNATVTFSVFAKRKPNAQ